MNKTLTKNANTTSFWNISPSGLSLDGSAIELGLYFIAVTCCAFFYLDKLKGKFKRMDNFLLLRKLEIFKLRQKNSKKVKNLLLRGSYAYFIMPIICLFGWVGLMFYDAVREKYPYVGAWSIFLIGVAFALCLYGVLKVKWSNYRLKWSSIIAVSVAIVFSYIY